MNFGIEYKNTYFDFKYSNKLSFITITNEEIERIFYL